MAGHKNPKRVKRKNVRTVGGRTGSHAKKSNLTAKMKVFGNTVNVKVVAKLPLEKIKNFEQLHKGLTKKPIASLQSADLMALAGGIVHSPAVHGITYGKKGSNIFAGNILGNIEGIWARFNNRIAKAGHEKVPWFASPKEKKALITYLTNLSTRTTQKSMHG